jgi:hypothetical protein
LCKVAFVLEQRNNYTLSGLPRIEQTSRLLITATVQWITENCFSLCLLKERNFTRRTFSDRPSAGSDGAEGDRRFSFIFSLILRLRIDARQDGYAHERDEWWDGYVVGWDVQNI